MLEIGKVIEIKGDRARVALPRKSECARCGKCGLGLEGGEMILEAENLPGARAGDRVEVELPERDPLLAALLLFGLPLLGMLLGVIAGTLLERMWGWDSEAPAVVLGVVLLLAAFFLVKFREKRLAKQQSRRNRIVRIYLTPDPSPRSGEGRISPPAPLPVKQISPSPRRGEGLREGGGERGPTLDIGCSLLAVGYSNKGGRDQT